MLIYIVQFLYIHVSMQFNLRTVSKCVFGVLMYQYFYLLYFQFVLGIRGYDCIH